MASLPFAAKDQATAIFVACLRGICAVDPCFACFSMLLLCTVISCTLQEREKTHRWLFPQRLVQGRRRINTVY